MTRQSSFGVCASCGTRKAKGGMVAHLRQCLITQSKQTGGPSSPILLLRAYTDGTSMFWLDLVATREAKLKDVDRLLRRVWLECCGHLSEFYVPVHRKVSMNTKVGDAFSSIGSRLGYVYDFGSSTELIISLSSVIAGNFGRSVQVVARNEPPTWPCNVCGQPAVVVCSQCEYEGTGFCCTEHEGEHDCGEEMLLPVVNSPRMGVCGYTGEA